MIDNAVAVRGWSLGFAPPVRVVNFVHEKFSGQIEYSISAPAKEPISGEMVSQAVLASMLKISFDDRDMSADFLSQSIPFKVNLAATTQDALDAYGHYLRAANQKLDKALNDTQYIADRIDKYLENHGGQ